MKSPTLPVCVAIFVLAGCSHTIPETATKPQAPPQLGKRLRSSSRSAPVKNRRKPLSRYCR